MKLYNVNDSEFKEYGVVLDGYDYSELFQCLHNVSMPETGIVYVASETALENCAEAKKMEIRGFGGYPVQLGYVSGKNRVLNCLEYHKSSEFNIAMDDIILVLGHKKNITDGKFDASLCKAFFVPAGTGVELYGTTLHYAPFHVNDSGYKMICVLPRGTNSPKIDFDAENFEDKMCFGVNKWLMAHKTASEVNDGAYVGITGNNITFDRIGD